MEEISLVVCLMFLCGSSGGFSRFSGLFPGLCEGKSSLVPSCISQPCLPVANTGPTRILPHLYLGCQRDVLDKVRAGRAELRVSLSSERRSDSVRFSA